MEENTKLIKSKSKFKLKKSYIIFTAIILSIILIDQITKILAFNLNNTQIIPNFLTIQIHENTSGNYGITSNSTATYILTNLIVVAILLKFLTSQNEFMDKKTRVFLSFIIAGGLSNVIDRVVRGYVVQFINISSLPPLNIADIFVIVGWISFFITFIIFGITEYKNKGKNKSKTNSNKDMENKKERN